jgi:hypothetical protein
MGINKPRHTNTPPKQLSTKPKYMTLQWPDIGEFIDDEDQDIPKPGQLMKDFCYRVSDLGFPILEDAMKMVQMLDK